MRADINSLDTMIKTELENWADKEVTAAANESFEEAAEEAEKMLKQGGPYRERTKKYTKDWTHGQRTTKKGVISGLRGYAVYNKKHYQLTHLLEKGHQSRNGGRVRAFTHIAPVNDQVGKMAVQKIERKLEG